MGISFSHILIILLVVILVFGSKRVPEVMKDLAKGWNVFMSSIQAPHGISEKSLSTDDAANAKKSPHLDHDSGAHTHDSASSLTENVNGTQPHEALKGPIFGGHSRAPVAMPDQFLSTIPSSLLPPTSSAQESPPSCVASPPEHKGGLSVLPSCAVFHASSAHSPRPKNSAPWRPFAASPPTSSAQESPPSCVASPPEHKGG